MPIFSQFGVSVFNVKTVSGLTATRFRLADWRRWLHASTAAWSRAAALSSLCLAGTMLPGGRPSLRAAETPPDQQQVVERFQAGQQALQQGRLDDAIAAFKKVVGWMPDLAEARMNLSLAYYLRGDYEQVVEQLGRVVQQRADLIPAHLFLGLSYLKTAAAAKAIPHLKTALKASPENREARGALAAAYLAEGDFHSAAREYQTISSQEPDKTQAWFQLGKRYFDLSKALSGQMLREHLTSAWASRLAGDVLSLSANFDDAVKHYQQALGADPRQPGLHASLGATLLKAGQFDAAAKEFEAELERDPNHERALLGMAERSLARGDAARAHEFASRIWKIFPEFLALQSDFPAFSLSAEQAANLASRLEELPDGGPTEFLISAVERAAGQSQKSADALGALKKELEGAARTPQASTAAEMCAARQYGACAQALEAQPKRGTRGSLLLGKAYLALGDTEKASDAFAAALSLDPQDPESLYWTVRTYQSLSGQYFRRVEEAAPDSWQSHQLRAEEHQLREADAGAITEYRRAIELNPNHPELRENLAILYLLDNAYDQAHAELEKALELDPARSRTHYLIGRLFVSLQDMEKAVPFLEVALRRDPSLVGAHANLGRAYLRLDRPAEAAAQLEQALDLDYYGDLHYSLFQAYRKLGKKEAAMKALARSQEMRKSSFARDQAKLGRWIRDE